MRRNVFIGFAGSAICFAFLLTVEARAQTIPIPPGAAGPSSVLKIRVDAGKVTAEIKQAPILSVLEELAARSGVVFDVPSQVTTPISIVLYKANLKEMIERVLADYDCIFYYQKDATGQSAIRTVQVSPRRQKGQNMSRRIVGTGAITHTSVDLIESPEQALKVLFDGKNVLARQKAIEVLAATKSEIAIQAITRALEDPAPEVKMAAIEALAALNARQALNAVLPVLKNENPGLRQSTVEAVALLGGAQNIKDLRPLLKDSDAGVAAAAGAAIRRLSERQP